MKMQFDKSRDIEVADEVATFESEQKLPSLYGTPRQVAWARNIRHQFLEECGTMWFDQACQKDNRLAICQQFDLIKNSTKAENWITKGRPFLGRAVEYVVSIPDLLTKIAREEEAERLRIAAEEQKRQEEVVEQRRLKAERRIIKKRLRQYEKDALLPELWGLSSFQLEYGRFCRYMVMLYHDGGGTAFETDPIALEAGYWIKYFKILEKGGNVPVIEIKPEGVTEAAPVAKGSATGTQGTPQAHFSAQSDTA